MARPLTGLGPDASGQWASGGVGLGRALAMTLPEDSYDRQPIHLADGSMLVADIRLDNRASLAFELGIEAARQREMADSQVLAAAWERWQEECLTRLAGAFAFAVWDEPSHRLFCARDQMGRRPLYFFSLGPLFAFASLPRGLRVLREVPWTVDETMIAIRLSFLPQTGERTYFDKIRKLPPAHALRVSEGGETVRRYWKPELHRPVEFRRDEDYCEAFREIFDEAVGCRLRARAPVGSMLSGGFDSGSVTASAARMLARESLPLVAFTAVPAPGFEGADPPDRFGNEAQHAASVAALYPNIRHVLVPPLAVCPLDLMARSRLWTDSPGGHFSMTPYAFAMAEAHRRTEVGVVLTGLHGNMTISYKGLPLLPQLIRGGQWRHWFREAQALRAKAWFGWRGVLANSFGPWMPCWLWHALQSDRSAPFRDVQRYVLLHPRYFRGGEIARLAAELDWDLAYPPPLDGRQARVANLERFDRGAGAAAGLALCGVDFRDPTIDRRLVEFCLAVPERQYLREGQTRYLLTRAMSGRLSPSVLHERRRGLCGADWYLRVAPYQARFAEAVEQVAQSPVARHCLDVERMRRLAARWPEDWDSLVVRREHGMGLCRAIQAGAFMRAVEEGDL